MNVSSLLLREEVVRCCGARGEVHERPGGHGVFPMEVDSFGQKRAKGKGSKGGNGKQRSDKERKDTTVVIVGTHWKGARKAKAAKTKAKAKAARTTRATAGKSEGGNTGTRKDKKDAHALEDPWQDPWPEPWPDWSNAKAGEEQNLMELAAWDPNVSGSKGRNLAFS